MLSSNYFCREVTARKKCGDVSLIVYSIFYITLAMIILAYFGNIRGVLLEDPSALIQLPLYKAFSSPQFFYFGIVAQLTTSATALFDLLLDYSPRQKDRAGTEIKESRDCWSERLFFIAINLCTGIVYLFLREDTNAPYIYTCVYCIQCAACFGAVLLMCNKLEPVYFTPSNIVGTYLSLCGTDLAEVIGVGHDIFYWSNILSFVTAGLFLWFVLGKIMVPWLRSLKARNLDEKPLTINELTCLWYSLSTLALKFFLPGVFMLPKFMQWSQCTSLQVHAFVYCLALLGVIICNISGRLARFTVEKERSLLADIRRIIRYLSHEVRSPLNIISSAIGFMELDMAGVAPCPAKASVDDSLSVMRQATQDILQTMNEMLQMETINSGSLSLDPQMVPCVEVMEIVQRSSVAAREKGVNFSVQEFLSRDQIVRNSSCVHDLESLRTIEDLPWLNEVAFHVDKFKIGQVVRNLVTNAVKFTPAGHSVSVNIRRTTAAEEAIIVEDSLKATRDGKKQKKGDDDKDSGGGRSDYHSTCHAVIEVVDTGAGISPEDHSKVFGAFTQFRVNELQGGGGTGLGLWISQEIMKNHGSMIHFRSEGLGKGTTFFFMLPMYVLQQHIEPVPLFQKQQQLTCDTIPAKFNMEPRVTPENTPTHWESAVEGLQQSITSNDNIDTYSNNTLDLKVLVVDDSKANLKFLVRHLRQAGTQQFQIRQQLPCQVNLELAEEMDGTTAVASVVAAAAAGRPFHMVFMDNIMKEMHGPEAARSMRQKGFAGLIVGVTGNVMQEDVSEYIKAGADHIMPKPITTADVAGMIQRMVTRIVNG